MAGLVKEISDDEFEAAVLKAGGTVIVDFWAPWCGPCKSIAPVLEDLAKQHEGHISFLKINIDENPQAAEKYGVRSIPNLIVFKDGQTNDQMTGYPSPEVVTAFVDRAL